LPEPFFVIQSPAGLRDPPAAIDFLVDEETRNLIPSYHRESEFSRAQNLSAYMIQAVHNIRQWKPSYGAALTVVSKQSATRPAIFAVIHQRQPNRVLPHFERRHRPIHNLRRRQYLQLLHTLISILTVRRKTPRIF